MLKRLIQVLLIGFAIVGMAAVAGIGLLMRSGISSRDEPGTLETAVARRLRSIAIPANARTLTNPEPANRETLDDGLTHFADHCASCHANDGSGQTEMGMGLYPRAPDMRQAETQNLTDGQLFYIIEHGVKLTGMPAWGNGTPEGARASWHLVYFIRRLPQLSPADLERMKSLNPRSATEWRQEEEERRFLDGNGAPPAPSHTHGGTE